MQKSLHFLKYSGKQGRRRGFLLISAVFLMLLLSLLLLKMLSYSTENAQQVVNDYLYEQAELLAYGAVEETMLAISATDPASGCFTGRSTHYPATGNAIFQITTSVQYVSTAGSALAACPTFATVTAPAQDGSALIDVLVEINASTQASLGIDDRIRYHRRTLQKL